MPRAVDAEERCPTCGHASWRVDTRPDGTRVLACADCGFDEPYPNMFRIEKVAGDELVADDQRPPHDWRAVLLTVEVPAYAPAGALPILARSLEPSGAVVAAQPEAGGSVAVETRRRASGDDEEALARAALGRTPADLGAWPRERSRDGQAVWLLARIRARRADAARVAATTAVMEVDGTPRPFRLVALGEWWAAARVDDHLTLVVEAEGVAPHEVALERLTEPSRGLS